MSSSTLAAFASRATICTISSRTSPLPPGNWCDARRVVGAAYVCTLAEASAAAHAIATTLIVLMLLLLRKAPILAQLDDALRAQAGDIGVAFFQRAQHFVRVFAEQRWCAAVFHRGGGKAHRARHHRQRPGRGVLELDADTARLDLRFGEDLGNVVDRTIRHASGIEEVDPLRRAFFQKDLLQEPCDFGAIFHALAVAGKARVRGQLLAAGRLTELAEQIVVAAGEDHIAVGGAKRLIGHDVRMQVADALGRLAGREVIGVLIREKSDLRIEERQVEVLAGAAVRAIRQRGANGDRCVHAGDDVGDRHAGALRTASGSPVWLTRDAHHAAHTLDHEVVSRALSVRSAMAEAGDRAVDEAGVFLAQVLVAETVAGEVSELVVLDQYVARARE